MSEQRCRVLLADDHTLVLEGIKKLLEPHFEVIGMVQDGRALLEAVRKHPTDVILIDVSMPLLNGIDAARQLRKIAPDTKIIFLSMHADPAIVTEAFEVGARGYLLKSGVAAELVFAIQEVVRGHQYVTPTLTKDLVEPSWDMDQATRERSPETTSRLTPRQREVLQLVAGGKSIKEIANTLNVSVKTVEFHKSRIMDELGLRSTAELTKYAVAHGLVSL